MIVPTSYLPATPLQDFVATYGILEVPEGAKENYFSPPIGMSGFIIQTNRASNNFVAKIDGRDFFTLDAVATGQVTLPVHGEISGPSKSILVFFHPLGMHTLFGVDMSTLTNKSKDLGDIIGREACAQLMANLESSQDNADQIEVLDSLFLSIMPNAQMSPDLEGVLELVHARKGGLTVQEMEENCHFHRKTLERHFQKKIGLSPKVYTQIYQFKCLMNLLQENPDITWSELCDRAGYYDQSHMSRYIREFLKVSPNNIVKLDIELINYLLRINLPICV